MQYLNQLACIHLICYSFLAGIFHRLYPTRSKVARIHYSEFAELAKFEPPKVSEM